MRNSLSVSPETIVSNKPDITPTTTTESPLSLELELEPQHVIDGLGHHLSVLADDELQFDGDKIRTGSDSAIGDVYSNGQCSNSSLITSKEADTSNSSNDLKYGETLPDKQPIAVHTNLDDDDDDSDCEHALPSIEQLDNLSSSSSWNLDGPTPEPELDSFSMPGESDSIQHSHRTIVVNEYRK